MLTEWLLLALAGVLIGANALFVAAEFGLVTVDRSEVSAAARDGDRSAARVLGALRSLSTQLSGAQLGITATSLLVGFLAEPSLARLLRGPLQSTGLAQAAATGLAVTVALVAATVVQMVFGELVPKNLAIARPRAVAQAVAPFQIGFTTAAGPLIRFLNGNANAVLRRVGVEPQEELAAARSPEELQSLVRRSGQVGTMPEGTARLLSRSLDFGDRTASDVMTPRVSVRSLRADDPVAEVVRLARATGLSRFPVTGRGGADDVTGLVELRRALRVPRDRRSTVLVREVARRPLVVPDSLELDPLLRQLREHGGQLAVVLDEYGGTAGIVTVEDLVEELVGEVEDEHDRPGSRLRTFDDGTVEVSGLLRPDELRELDVPVPEDPAYETVAGYVAARLGRVPEVGDEIELEGWHVTVVAREGLRVDRLRCTPHPPAGGGEER